MFRPSTSPTPPRLRVCILIGTNVGGVWAVPPAKALIDAGHDVLAIVGDEPGSLDQLFRDVGSTVLKRPSLTPGSWSWAKSWNQTRRDIAEYAPDALLYYLYKSAMYGRTIGFLQGVPTIHAMVSPILLEIGSTRLAERLLLRLDSHVIAGSEAIRRSLHHTGRKDNVSVIYPALELKKFLPVSPEERRAARAQLGISDDAFVAIMVAYWYAPKRIASREPHFKGHDLAVEGWNLSGPKPEDRFLVVGGGFRDAGRHFRDDYIENNPGAETVEFVEHTDNVRLYYAAADVSLAPSATENLGASAEASAVGVPTIATRVGGFAEIVIPGYTGWLLRQRTAGDIAEAIVEAREAKDSGALATMGQRATEIAPALLDGPMNARKTMDVVARTISAYTGRRSIMHRG